MASSKPHVSIVFCGNTDSGKSTTAGRLLYELGALPESELEKLKEAASAKGAPAYSYAWAMDREKDERERLHTIFCNTQELSTARFRYTIIDAPGLRDYSRNLITGASQADVGLLMVPAGRIAEFRVAMDRDGYSYWHSFLLKELGVKQLIVCVNKLETGELQYREVASVIKDKLVQTGWRRDFVEKSVPIIPISGYHGDNLTKKSEKFTWWSGVDVLATNGATVHVDTLLDALDNFVQAPGRKTNAPLRLPISGVYKVKDVGTVVAGRVEQGAVKAGDEVVFLPTHTDDKKCEGTVLTVEVHRNRVDQAAAGDSVGINITGLDGSNLPRMGNVMILKSDTTLKLVKDFTAQVQTINIKLVKVGYSPIGIVRCGHAACRITSIKWKESKVTREKKVAPEYLMSNEVAEVVFEPVQPLVLDSFANSDGLSRIIFLDSDNVVMTGRVVSTTAK